MCLAGGHDHGGDCSEWSQWVEQPKRSEKTTAELGQTRRRRPQPSGLHTHVLHGPRESLKTRTVPPSKELLSPVCGKQQSAHKSQSKHTESAGIAFVFHALFSQLFAYRGVGQNLCQQPWHGPCFRSTGTQGRMS